ncbi:MAG TPA: O-antigen ligase family protein [Gemmatimonadales bacterium]|nr:O-antigen ligase family protein [Gemmatimonadales bacterium]
MDTATRPPNPTDTVRVLSFTAAAPPAEGWPAQPAPDRRWNFLLVCVAAYILTSVGRVHQLFSWLEPLHLALLAAGAGIAFLLLSNSGLRSMRPVLRSVTTRVVLGIAVWMALSIPGALWPGGALHLFLDQFAKAAAMFVVVASAIRGPRDVERLTFVYLAGVTIYAAMLLVRFRVSGDGADWRLGSLYYYDANEFATLAVMAIPLALFFVVRSGSTLRRLTAVGALVVLVVAFIWAGSRGGFLALLAVGAFLLLRYQAVHVGWRVLVAAALTLLFVAAASDTYWDQMRTIAKPQDDYNMTGDQGRVQVWKRGLWYMETHPILGVGAANFPTAEGTLSPLARAQAFEHGVKWSAAHNSYLEIGAELGVPGLLLFLVLLGSGFASLRRVREAAGRTGGRSPPVQLAQAFAGSLIGFMVGGFFLSLAYHDLLYVLLALITGLRMVVVASPLKSRRRTEWSFSQG